MIAIKFENYDNFQDIGTSSNTFDADIDFLDVETLSLCIQKSYNDINELVTNYNGYTIEGLIVFNKTIEIPQDMYIYFKLKNIDLLIRSYTTFENAVYSRVTINNCSNIQQAVMLDMINLYDYLKIKEFIYKKYSSNIVNNIISGIIVFDNIDYYENFKEYLHKTYGILTSPMLMYT